VGAASSASRNLAVAVAVARAAPPTCWRAARRCIALGATQRSGTHALRAMLRRQPSLCASQLYMTPPYSDASLTVAAGSSWCACDPGIQASMFCSLPRARTGTKHEHPCAQ